ncbi:carbohydrate ABC transporter permease [Rhizobium paknamense]|uniref:Alpha-glucoside transport system permease protein n=1 Tax=Rhizobium paknamense TaxID=1206817 RepID=A0ABU0IFJ8_9HYPH|nr:carbohydrate ABC transporter permease [Rhizobium paknamense]MDQ0457021.1 alpha-glucoside transport system permease protein [Rhizobium paknamense]
MRTRALSPLSIAVHLSVLVLVVLWTVPTAGLLISSLRDKEQISASGWWTALTSASRKDIFRAPGPEAQKQEGAEWVISGNIFNGGSGHVSAFGTSSLKPEEFTPGATAELKDGQKLTVSETGDFRLTSPQSFEGSRGQRIFYTALTPPRFSFDNYRTVLTAEGIGQSFLNSLTVAVPSTIIPILVAAFAAYALAWMKFPGRSLLIAAIVGLLVVPLQMSLIPLLKMYNGVGAFFGVPSKTYLGIWLAHMGFGLPLAIYLLRNYIAGLPKEIMESARVDGATDFEIFVKIVLPLSYPALASFAIFQFLWTWNDLLVAMVFLGTGNEELVLTGRLVNLLGSRGANWEILTASAFITIIVPLLVFFTLQRYLVRGLLAGSVKGG